MPRRHLPRTFAALLVCVLAVAGLPGTGLLPAPFTPEPAGASTILDAALSGNPRMDLVSAANDPDWNRITPRDISADERYVLLRYDHFCGDGCLRNDQLYRLDTTTGSKLLVSNSPDGSAAGVTAGGGSMTPDGDQIVFGGASTYAPDPANTGGGDVTIYRQLSTGTYKQLNFLPDGTPGYQKGHGGGMLSDDGRRVSLVMWDSYEAYLDAIREPTPSDAHPLYVIDTATARPITTSKSLSGAPVAVYGGLLSNDGTTLLFSSTDYWMHDEPMASSNFCDTCSQDVRRVSQIYTQDVATGTLALLPIPPAGLDTINRSVAFSGDGSVVAVIRDDRIFVVADGAYSTYFGAPSMPTSYLTGALAVSPDGRYVAWGANGPAGEYVARLDRQRNEITKVTNDTVDNAFALQVLPDGRVLLAAGLDGDNPVQRTYIGYPDPHVGNADASVPPEHTMGSGSLGPNPAGLQADPVNTATGALYDAVTDVAHPGIGVGFAMTRTYNSNDAIVGELGRGWVHSSEMRADLDTSTGTATVRGGDGQQIRFALDTQSGTWSGAGAAGTLTTTTDGSLAYTGRDLTRFDFDTSGRLESVTDRNGQGQHITRDPAARTMTVTGSGRATTFHYDDTTGLLASVVTHDGRTVTYGYTTGALGNPLLTTVTDIRGKTWTYTYDDQERQTSLQDPNTNFVHRTTYGTDGRVTSQLDPNGHESTFSWDAATGQAIMTDPNGGQWIDVYEGNVLILRADPTGAKWAYYYDDQLRLVETIDPAGETTSFGYDPAGLLTSTTRPDGTTVRSVYNARADVIETYDTLGQLTTYAYDAAGNLESVTTPDNQTASTVHHPGTGLVTSRTAPGGLTTTFGYDTTTGDLLSVTDPAGRTTTFGYDPAGRRTRMTRPAGNVPGADPAPHTTTWTYDGNLVATETHGTGRSSTYNYDDAGRVSSVVDHAGRSSSFTYDDAGHVLTETGHDPDVPAVVHTYTPTGKRATTTGAAGTATYSYDDAGRLIDVDGPAGQVGITYDHAGRIATSTDPGGQVSSFAYDEMGRTLSADRPGTDTDVSWTYDDAGRLETMTDQLGTTSYAYDKMSRTTQVARPSGTFVYEWNARGQIVERTRPDGTIDTFTYDPVTGELSTTAVDGQVVASYTYDAAGHRASTAFGNGVLETYDWDPAGMIEQVTATRGATTVSDITYSRDVDGNPTLVTEPGGPTAHTYDSHGRLTRTCYAVTACGTETDWIAWTYDSAGRRATEDRPEGTTTYTYGADGRLETTAGPVDSRAYDHDTNGNVVSDGASVFEWDALDRLTVAIDPASLPTARLVVGNTASPDVVDTVFADRLETAGWSVSMVDDGTSATSITDGADIVIVSDTVDPGVLGTRLDTATVGVLVLEPELYDEFRITSRSGNWGVLREDGQAIVADPTSPLVAGRSGTVTLANPRNSISPGALTYSKPGGSPLTPIHATGGGGTGKKHVAAWDAGAALASGTAPARRVTSFANYENLSSYVSNYTTGERTTYLTEDGWAILLASINWAANDALGSDPGSRFSYDGTGHRTSATHGGETTTFVQDPVLSGLVAEVDETGAVVRSYLPNRLGVDSSGGRVFHHRDALGTPRVGTDSAGLAVMSQSFEPFGTPLASTGTPGPVGFTGHHTGPDGLVHMGARVYQPATGSFLSLDPLGDGYRYAANNPMVLTDPTGLSASDCNPFDFDVRGCVGAAHDASGWAATGGAGACLFTLGAGCVLTAVGGAVHAGTGIAQAYDTCTGGSKGSCGGAVIEAAMETAGGRYKGAPAVGSSSHAVADDVVDLGERYGGRAVSFGGTRAGFPEPPTVVLGAGASPGEVVVEYVGRRGHSLHASTLIRDAMEVTGTSMQPSRVVLNNIVNADTAAAIQAGVAPEATSIGKMAAHLAGELGASSWTVTQRDSHKLIFDLNLRY